MSQPWKAKKMINKLSEIVSKKDLRKQFREIVEQPNQPHVPNLRLESSDTFIL